MRRYKRSASPARAPLALALALALAPALAASTATAAPGDAYATRLALRQWHQAGGGHSAAQAPPAPVGTTRPVTSCADDGDPGTLRNVLASAEEGDIVDLSALTCSTITLTQGELDTSVLGEHHLYDITVQGPGRDALTIDANGLSQVFMVGGFSSNTGTFTLNDVTVANGSYAGSLAACILGFGGAVELNRVTVTNCHSSGTQKLVFGGAVDVTTLRMTDSAITGSSLTATGVNGTGIGGGAYSTEDATLVRSTVSGNTVVAPWADREGYITRGGGLYVNGNLDMVDSTVSGNAISVSNDGEDAGGGGIYVRGVASINGSTISGNSADGSGGDIFKAVFSIWGDPPPPQDTRIELFNSTVSGNSATTGAGLLTRRPAQLWNSTIAFNQASGSGGGVLLDTTGADGAAGALELQSTILCQQHRRPRRQRPRRRRGGGDQRRQQPGHGCGRTAGTARGHAAGRPTPVAAGGQRRPDAHPFPRNRQPGSRRRQQRRRARVRPARRGIPARGRQRGRYRRLRAAIAAGRRHHLPRRLRGFAATGGLMAGSPRAGAVAASTARRSRRPICTGASCRPGPSMAPRRLSPRSCKALSRPRSLLQVGCWGAQDQGCSSRASSQCLIAFWRT
ncbi:MAG: hypothetical protein J0H15_05225 [Xanthomonadales bacterium]|nr:hypothetical protein [Xanthomonadales bacterium]